jgi:hypothetical protein
VVEIFFKLIPKVSVDDQHFGNFDVQPTGAPDNLVLRNHAFNALSELGKSIPEILLGRPIGIHLLLQV